MAKKDSDVTTAADPVSDAHGALPAAPLTHPPAVLEVLLMPRASPATGNWSGNNGRLTIAVSATGDWRYELLMAIHQVVEAVLCRHRGVSAKAVTAFTAAYELERTPTDVSIAGMARTAPHYREHVFATVIEKLMAHQLGVTWRDYEKAKLGRA
jgi:hypothetical protein